MTAGKARIGVVGAGWWSTYTHIPGLLENPNAELAGICDTNDEAVRRVAEAFPEVPTYADVGEMLQAQSLDGVVVAIPHVAHHRVAAQCLDRGLHVMVEKPLTLTAADAKDLVGRAGRAVDRWVSVEFHSPGNSCSGSPGVRSSWSY